MTSYEMNNWIQEFGVEKASYPGFFSSINEITDNVPQSHVLRHAFEQLSLDGILCLQNSPLIYFRLVDSLDSEEILSLHKQFWNHGGAPVLVLITNDQVNVYSGMSKPVPNSQIQEKPSSLVTVLDKVSTVLTEFLTSVESGEFFRINAKSFNPSQRVDHDLLNNLKNTRELLQRNSDQPDSSATLDALLCRLVFTCYLFDRGVIGENYLHELGLSGLKHLRDVLKLQPPYKAKKTLYRLFKKLGDDFNGDLFNDDLEKEVLQISDQHIQVLKDFFHGTNVSTGQIPFWPYDFRFIPIETISAIYEHFLKSEDHEKGAFYTPRFLAEIVLDSALAEFDTLIGKKFLDPACGSGIFLVGVFNRLAEEWRQNNPNARNDRRARELMALLKKSIFGIDINPTACRITAFSLYLAYLDQLTPRDIILLREKGAALPSLVIQINGDNMVDEGNIKCMDFFAASNIDSDVPHQFENVDLVIGNPPWGSIAKAGSPASIWCKDNRKPIPDSQIASAFIWKAAEHTSGRGHVCFILPHGVLFNHGTTARKFQKAWLNNHTIENVLNLSDLRKFLFNEAKHPAIVVNYSNHSPDVSSHEIEYWCPKADWLTTQTEIIPISPLDRENIPLSEINKEMSSEDGTQLWTRKYWGSNRDLRLIERLSLYSRLRDNVQQSRDRASEKPWYMAEGFQPFGKNDPENTRKKLKLPTTKFLSAKSKSIDLFILEEDCDTLDSDTIEVRRKIQNTDIFKAPHVLITKGFKRIAYADFDVSFQRTVGVHGPKKDRNLMIFLAAYLRSAIAKYYAFHTSHNWSMFHEEVQVNELLRLPFPLPGEIHEEQKSMQIINQVSQKVEKASNSSQNNFLKRASEIDKASKEIEELIYEYFDIHQLERILIEDTNNVLIKSIQPTKSKMPVPTVKHCNKEQQILYKDRLCEMLNQWSKNNSQVVKGSTSHSVSTGIGIVMLEILPLSSINLGTAEPNINVVHTLHKLRNSIPQKMATIDPVRSFTVFEGNKLYIVKPLSQRYWTQTTALNDADKLVGTILSISHQEKA